MRIIKKLKKLKILMMMKFLKERDKSQLIGMIGKMKIQQGKVIQSACEIPYVSFTLINQLINKNLLII